MIRDVNNSLNRLPGRRFLARAAWLLAAGVAGASLLVTGCRHDVEERLGIDEKKGTPQFDPTSLDSSGELEKALATSTIEIAKRLGSYRLVQRAKVEVGAGERKDSLDETWTLEVDAKGNSRTLHENNHGYGVETFFVDGTFYVRPKYSQLVKRVPEADEVERARDEIQGVLASYLDVLGRFAKRKDAGAMDVGGRKAHKVALSLDSSPEKLRDPDPTHAWRKSIKASALVGEMQIDDASGAPLHATLVAAYTGHRLRAAAGEGKATDEEVRVALDVKADMEAIGSLPAVTAPVDAIASPLRPRPILDRQALLDGLVTLPTKRDSTTPERGR